MLKQASNFTENSYFVASNFFRLCREPGKATESCITYKGNCGSLDLLWVPSYIKIRKHLAPEGSEKRFLNKVYQRNNLSHQFNPILLRIQDHTFIVSVTCGSGFPCNYIVIPP